MAPAPKGRKATLLMGSQRPSTADTDELAAQKAPSRGRGATWTGPLGGDRRSRPSTTRLSGTGDRPSLGGGRRTLGRLSRLSRHSTTIIELNEVASRLSVVTADKVPIKRQLALSTAAGLLLVLLVVVALVGGVARWVLLGLIFVVVSGFLAVYGVRLLPRLAARYGELELPGTLMFWVGVGVTLLGGTGALLTWGLSEASTSLARAAFPQVRPDIPEPPPPPPAPPPPAPADENLARDRQVRVRPGLLYVPPNLSAPDGTYDLLVHFHGNQEIVKASVVSAGINAVVHVTNLGLRSGPYKQWAGVPDAFDRLLDDTNDKLGELGLKDAKLGRVAVASWSAGYGALLHILDKERHRQRIDAVLIMDGMHGGYRSEGDVNIHPLSLAAFVQYAEQARDAGKLFVLTHSAIEVSGYASSGASASYLLDVLGITRTPTSQSPPPVDIEPAIHAFPAAERNWLHGESEAHQGGVHVYGYTGNVAADHIAHLAQMAVTVLPPLATRWAKRR
ncbi:MAG: hypothetical protein KC731_29380 [Myxococcales bacterium]|nr:hypothetical protein [Myxococcales bacterium]